MASDLMGGWIFDIFSVLHNNRTMLSLLDLKWLRISQIHCGLRDSNYNIHSRNWICSVPFGGYCITWLSQATFSNWVRVGSCSGSIFIYEHWKRIPLLLFAANQSELYTWRHQAVEYSARLRKPFQVILGGWVIKQFQIASKIAVFKDVYVPGKCAISIFRKNEHMLTLVLKNSNHLFNGVLVDKLWLFNDLHIILRCIEHAKSYGSAIDTTHSPLSYVSAHISLGIIEIELTVYWFIGQRDRLCGLNYVDAWRYTHTRFACVCIRACFHVCQ